MGNAHKEHETPALALEAREAEGNFIWAWVWPWKFEYFSGFLLGFHPGYGG